MSKEKYKQIISLILIIIWMITVFMFSNQNGDESQKTSNAVTKVIVRILTFNQDITEEQELKSIENLDFVIRKLAHYSIYLLGGILIWGYINTFDIALKKKIIISIIIGAAYATFDELHQYFIANRSANIIDVSIDSIGVITGVALMQIKAKRKP